MRGGHTAALAAGTRPAQDLAQARFLPVHQRGEHGRGAIPLDEALPIAQRVAAALEAAHDAGVIRRDLKPANIRVRHDGTVKVLDFGPAKIADPPSAVSQAAPALSPTLTSPALTQMGVILGTAAYMAPEEA